MIGSVQTNCVICVDWSSSMFCGKFYHFECNVCNSLIKGFPNFSADVRVPKNVGGPSCLIIANRFFLNPSK